MESKICVIAPYDELAELAERVKRETGLNFSVRVGVLEMTWLQDAEKRDT